MPQSTTPADQKLKPSLNRQPNPTLVFLPGTLCTSAMFQPFLDSQHYQSIAFSLPLVSSLAETTQSIKHTIQDQAVILVGFSMGGMLAFDFIRQYPNQVLGLCLLNSNCHADLPGKREAREQQLAFAKQHGITALINETYLPIYFPSPNPTAAEIVKQMAHQAGLDSFGSQLQILANRPDSTATLTAFQQPTLIIGAEHDIPCPPEHQQYMAQANPNAELHILQDAGHFAPLEQASHIKRLIERWIIQHYA